MLSSLYSALLLAGLAGLARAAAAGYVSTTTVTTTKTFISTYTTCASTRSYKQTPTFTSCSSGLHPTYTSTNINFDDLSFTPGVAIVDTNPIPNGYKNLGYQNIEGFAENIKTYGLGAGVATHSLPNGIVSPFSTVFKNGVTRFSVYYPGSTTLSFSLLDLYYGFTEDLDNDASDVVADGVFTVTGYRGTPDSESAKQICAFTFKYIPTTPIGVQQMTWTGDLWGCDHLQFAEWTFQGYQTFSAPGVNDDVALLMDNLNTTMWVCH